MSTRLFVDDVKFLQRMLCSAGCYSGAADGVWSKKVDDGDQKLSGISEELAAAHGSFDARSEANIRSLHPKAQEAARMFLTAVRAAGFDARIISGTRTYAEQDALYRVGRYGDATRKPVTKARGGQSNHNFGIAWDIGLFENGKYVTKDKPYKEVARLCPPSVEWGGNWKSFPDTPHYQLALDKGLTEIRACFEKGTPFVNV